MSVAATHDTTSAQWSKRPFIVENVCYMSKKGKLLNVRPIFLGHINLHIHTHARIHRDAHNDRIHLIANIHERLLHTEHLLDRNKIGKRQNIS